MRGGGRGGRWVVRWKEREAYFGLWAVRSFLSASIYVVVDGNYVTKAWKNVGSARRIMAVPQGGYTLYSNILYCACIMQYYKWLMASGSAS